MKILITGFFGVNNFGDDIMLKKFCEEILEQDINADITLLLIHGSELGFTLPESIKIIKLDKIRKGKSFLFKWWFSRKYDALFWIGGTCFTEAAGDGSFTYMKAFKDRKKSFGYIGVGIGELLSQERIQKLKYLLDNSSLVTLRDKESYEYAKGLSGNPEIYECDDLMWLECKDIITSPSYSNERTLLISWRDFSIYYESGIENRAISSIVDFVEDVHEDFDKILIMPMGNLVDINRNKEIYHMLAKRLPDGKTVYSQSTDIYERISAITSSVLNITGRLHSIFVSEVYSVRTIAIGYDNKIEKFLDSIDRTESLIYPPDISYEALRKMYNIKKNRQEDIDYNPYYNKSIENIFHFNRFIDNKNLSNSSPDL